MNYTVKANLTDTGISKANGWTFNWKSSPSATFTNYSLTSTDVTFGSYGTSYTITYIAIPPS